MSKKTETVAFQGDEMRSAGPMQIRFLKEANASFNLAVGGYGSGKTVAAATKFITFAERFPPDKDIAILGVTQQAIMRNVVRPIIYPFYGEDKVKDLHKTEQRIVLPNGRSVHIIGAADADSEDRIAGMTLAAIYYDEVTRIHKHAFAQGLNRLRVPGARAYASSNTDSPSHWLKRQYLDRLDDRDEDGNPVLDWKVLQFQLTDNPTLDKKFQKDFKNRLMSQGQAEYDRGVSGMWVDRQGLVYNNLDSVFGDPPDTEIFDEAYGLDWATEHATVFLKLQWLADEKPDEYPTVWVVDELVVNNEGENLPPYMIADKFKEWVHPPEKAGEWIPSSVARVHVDPQARVMRAAMWERIGVRCWTLPESGTWKGMRDVNAGVARVAEAFGKGRLKVSHRCQFLADSLRSYVWDEKATEKGMPQRPAKDGPDDAADALRYAVVSNLRKWF